MILAEFEAIGALEISVFQRLLAWNGTKPFRLVSWPTVMPLQVPLAANALAANAEVLELSCRNSRASAASAYLIECPQDRRIRLSVGFNYSMVRLDSRTMRTRTSHYHGMEHESQSFWLVHEISAYQVNRTLRGNEGESIVAPSDDPSRKVGVTRERYRPD